MSKTGTAGSRSALLVATAAAAALVVGWGRAAGADATVEANPDATTGEWSRHFEIGGFLGGHFFSDDTGLGVSQATLRGNGPKDAPAFGLRLGWEFVKRLSVELELALMPTIARQGGADALVIGYRGQLLYRFLSGGVQPFIVAGYGGMTLQSSSHILVDEAVGAFQAGIGAKFPVGKDFGLRLDGRVLLPPTSDPKGTVTVDVEVLASAYSVFGRRKQPPRPLVVDRDYDGIPDDQDQCPEVAGPLENTGCPDKDSDGDGALDRLDKCPAEVGPKENEYCPDKDTDTDGLVDRLDKCAAEAGPRENSGCPDSDADKDGVVNRLDKCANQAGPAENYGCPLPPQVQKFTGVIVGITFVGGSAKIGQRSLALLDQAAALLATHPHLPLEIAGYTSSDGRRERNVELSRQRAEAVKQYLVGKGIAATRLSAVGLGPDNPIADNKTRSGRDKNRRIEFHIKAQAEAAPPATPPSP